MRATSESHIGKSLEGLDAFCISLSKSALYYSSNTANVTFSTSLLTYSLDAAIKVLTERLLGPRQTLILSTLMHIQITERLNQIDNNVKVIMES
jgi:hypothetical protein